MAEIQFRYFEVMVGGRFYHCRVPAPDLDEWTNGKWAEAEYKTLGYAGPGNKEFPSKWQPILFQVSRINCLMMKDGKV